MNIFVVDEDPEVAARQLCDKHVVKMILESAQMLCTVAHEHGFVAPYKKAHPKHPCTLWAGKSPENWSWLIAHGLAMPEQYKNDCAVTAYRAYYHGEKANFATWKSEVPQWWTAA